jgi:hypothetical protein
MRTLVIVILLGLARVASADGAYVVEGFGVAGFDGGLRAYGLRQMKLQIGAGVWKGPWSVELFGGGMTDFLAVDCYGEECGSGPPEGSLSFAGLDVAKRWGVLESRWPGLSVRIALHGGIRYFVGDDALKGYQGPGIGAGVRLEANAWVIGYFVDLGIDAMALRMPADSVTGTSPFLLFGARVGWL